MGFRKITLFEGLFAVIITSFMLVVITFSTIYYNLKLYEIRIFDLSLYTLTICILLMIIQYRYNVKSLKELNYVMNLKSFSDVIIAVNCNIIFMGFCFLLDCFKQFSDLKDIFQILTLIFIITFLIGNFVAVFSANFIDYESSKFLSIERFGLSNFFRFLYYTFWIIFFILLSFLLLFLGYPLIAVSILIFGLINVNLLSHCSSKI